MISDIAQLLVNDPDVTNLIGQNNVLDRFKIWPVVRPQRENGPGITYRKSGERVEYCGNGIDHRYSVIIIMIYSKDYPLLDQVELEIETNFNTNNAIQKSNSRDLFEEQSDEYVREITIEYRT